jgi:hypothetical protein
VNFINSSAVDQYKITGGTQESLVETIHTPAASHYEGNFFANTLNSLNDSNPTTLSDSPPVGTPLGPGDTTWAYEWDKSLMPGAQLIINKDKDFSITPVPEPGTMALLGLAAVAMCIYERGRRRV